MTAPKTWNLPAHLYDDPNTLPAGHPDRAWLAAHEEHEHARMRWIADHATVALLGTGFIILRHEDTSLDMATLHAMALYEGTPATLRRRAVLAMHGAWSAANALAAPDLLTLAAELPEPWTYRLPPPRRPGRPS